MLLQAHTIRLACGGEVTGGQQGKGSRDVSATADKHLKDTGVGPALQGLDSMNACEGFPYISLFHSLPHSCSFPPSLPLSVSPPSLSLPLSPYLSLSLPLRPSFSSSPPPSHHCVAPTFLCSASIPGCLSASHCADRRPPLQARQQPGNAG